MRGALVLVVVLAGCGYEGLFICDSDAQCRHDDVVGQCAATGGAQSDGSKYCLFPDTNCAMGMRWDKHAGEGYDKLCYGEAPPAPVDASTGSGSGGSSGP